MKHATLGVSLIGLCALFGCASEDGVSVDEDEVVVGEHVARAAAPLSAPPGHRAKCAKSKHAGGDWPALNQDVDNNRHQRQEKLIDVNRARNLTPAWSFAIGSTGATGGLRSTPIVADGCVYIAAGMGYFGPRGDIFALNADTGELVWHVQTDGSVLGLAAANGMIYATPSKGTREVATPTVTQGYEPAGSYAIALDGQTGATKWISERLDDGSSMNGIFVNASPVVFTAAKRPMVFVPLSGGGGDGARVPMYFIDAMTGATVLKTYTLKDEEYKAGFGGTGIWSTAAYDPKTQHLYAGTADSDGKTKQHPYNNAILKIDANPSRATFGSVVASYAGTSERADLEQLIPGFGDTPLCSELGGNDPPVDPPTFFDTSASVECLELDLDFGASPHLYTGGDGALKVAALQKSGLLHNITASTMQRDWAALVSPGHAAANSATGAIGDDSIYVGATPNLLYGLNQASGATRWVSQSGADVFAYQPLTLANGVLYTITDMGVLLGFEAATGAPILQRSIGADAGLGAGDCLGAGAGVAVARNTVYVPCDAGGPNDIAGLPGTPGALVAYR